MAKEQVKRLFYITYREESDHLFATVVPAVPAESDEIASDLYVRIVDDQVVGFECIDFSEHVTDASWLLGLPQFGTFICPNGTEMSLPEFLEHLWEEISRGVEIEALEAVV